MAEKNLYINRLLSDPVYFADLVNGVLFDGRQQLNPRQLTPVADASGVVYAAPDGVRRVVERHRMNLVNASDPGELSRFQTHLQQIFGVLKYNHDKDGLFRYLHENREALQTMSETAKQALFSVMGEQKRLMRLLEERRDEEALDMCQAIDDLIADGEARGQEQGKKIGEERLSALISKLLDEGRTDLIRQVTCDAGTREQLYRRYQM